jgi:transcriptional regulator with XRE-family HTH domain
MASKGREPEMVGFIREAIARSPLPLLELGQRAGVNVGQLSRFVRGERGLSLAVAARLCEALGLELTWRAGEPPPPRDEPRRGPGRPPKARPAAEAPASRKPQRRERRGPRV